MKTHVLEIRVQKGIRASHLCKDAGIGMYSLWLIENDPDANPRVRTLAKIAKALGVKVADLIEEE